MTELGRIVYFARSASLRLDDLPEVTTRLKELGFAVEQAHMMFHRVPSGEEGLELMLTAQPVENPSKDQFRRNMLIISSQLPGGSEVYAGVEAVNYTQLVQPAMLPNKFRADE